MCDSRCHEFGLRTATNYDRGSVQETMVGRTVVESHNFKSLGRCKMFLAVRSTLVLKTNPNGDDFLQTTKILIKN